MKIWDRSENTAFSGYGNIISQDSFIPIVSLVSILHDFLADSKGNCTKTYRSPALGISIPSSLMRSLMLNLRRLSTKEGRRKIVDIDNWIFLKTSHFHGKKTTITSVLSWLHKLGCPIGRCPGNTVQWGVTGLWQLSSLGVLSRNMWDLQIPQLCNCLACPQHSHTT